MFFLKKSALNLLLLFLVSLIVPSLLANTPLVHLSDEFDDAATLNQWQRLYQTESWGPAGNFLNVHDIDTTVSGAMVLQPHSNAWFGNLRGPLTFKTLSGNFAITSQITIRNGQGQEVLPTSLYSLGGLMIRRPRPEIISGDATWTVGDGNPDSAPNGENYTFLSMGYGDDNMTPEPDSTWQFEVKTTRNSNSVLEITDSPSNTARIQLVSIGNLLSHYVIALIEQDGVWRVHRRYEREDFAGTELQVGLVAYTDWDKVSTYFANGVEPYPGPPIDGIRYHNANYLSPTNPNPNDPSPFQPFNADVQALFDYAHFASVEVPLAYANSDFTDPGQVSDADLLAMFGESADITGAPIPEPTSAVLLAVSLLVLTRRRRRVLR